MLQKANPDAAYCRERAEENRRMAQGQVDSELRKTYLNIEALWLLLAYGYERPEQLNQYTAPTLPARSISKRRHKKGKPLRDVNTPGLPSQRSRVGRLGLTDERCTRQENRLQNGIVPWLSSINWESPSD
jgi:hypothetical protein